MISDRQEVIDALRALADLLEQNAMIPADSSSELYCTLPGNKIDESVAAIERASAITGIAPIRDTHGMRLIIPLTASISYRISTVWPRAMELYEARRELAYRLMPKVEGEE